jgi:hypothetical protein
MKKESRNYTFDKPAIYRIRVEGVLDKSWSSRLSGMQITRDENIKNKPITILYGYLPDQPALSGILNSLYDLGLTILAVECLSEE